MFGVSVVGEGDVNQADGFIFRATVGAGDSRNREAEVCVRAMTNAAGHVTRNLLADSAEFANQFLVHAQQARL